MKVTKRASGRHGVPRPPYVLVSVVTVTVLAAISALAPPRMLMFGWVALGPALAAATANPAAVLGVGGYAVAAGFAVSSWQGLFGSVDQILRLLMVAAAIIVLAPAWVRRLVSAK